MIALYILTPSKGTMDPSRLRMLVIFLDRNCSAIVSPFCAFSLSAIRQHLVVFFEPSPISSTKDGPSPEKEVAFNFSGEVANEDFKRSVLKEHCRFCERSFTAACRPVHFETVWNDIRMTKKFQEKLFLFFGDE